MRIDRDFKDPKHIVISGASGGIGAALARHYARDGVMLGLIGRDKARLDAVAETCRDLGAEVEAALIDVTNEPVLSAWLLARDDVRAVDLVIANAGVSAGTGGDDGEDKDQVRHIFNVNVHGVMNSIHPLLPRMVERGHGQIALMASLAGFRGWPGAPAYCASKAAVKTYGEALRGSLYGSGVAVNVICPGFVKSAMTDANNFAMPFMVSAEKAAKNIACGLARNKGRIAFPFPAHFVAWLFSIMPDAFSILILRKTPRKE